MRRSAPFHPGIPECLQTTNSYRRRIRGKNRLTGPDTSGGISITNAGFTQESTSRTIKVGDMPVHFHDVGEVEPVVMLHSNGPGTTGWITFHKVPPALAEHYRCIVMDLPNFGRTGPVVYNEPLHNLQARAAVGYMDALGIERSHLFGNSQGGQSAMVLAAHDPHRVNKLVFGACHIRTGGDLYLMGNRPSEGSLVTREVRDNPTRDNVRRYLRTYDDDSALVTDELVDYIYNNYTGNPDHIRVDAESVSVPYDHGVDLSNINAPSLIIWGRYDQMCIFEIGIAALNNLEDSRLVLLNNCGHWVPFEKPEEYASHVLNFLRG